MYHIETLKNCVHYASYGVHFVMMKNRLGTSNSVDHTS